MGKHLSDFAGMPALDPMFRNVSDVVAFERAKYPMEQQQQKLDGMLPKLNAGQRAVFDCVMRAVNGEAQGGTAFFVDGLGGAGKTFLYTTILCAVRAQGSIALASASSGIAALLLLGGRTTTTMLQCYGRTAHSRFKIPVKLSNVSSCNVHVQHDLAQLFREAALIVLDEAPMLHRWAVEAVDRMLRDVMATVDTTNKDKLFGGKVVVLGGDFRQVVPVVRKGTRGQIVNACINQSHDLWPHITVYQLHKNMRVQTLRAAGDQAAADRQERFAAWLQRVGDGTEQTFPEVGEEYIRVPDEIAITGEGGQGDGTLEQLMDAVYGGVTNLPTVASRTRFIVERAILTPLNEHVDAINECMTDRMCAVNGVQMTEYLSADSVVGDQGSALYPVEFLDGLNASGLPSHKLRLHVGCPIILLRNMSGGLANGTRLIVTQLMHNVIKAKVATGPAKDTTVLLPRLNITPSDDALPFVLCRRQFPIKPAYAMTVNKSQGQTLKAAGVYLPKPVFGHGQLYVAFSRVGIWEALKVLVVGGYRAATETLAAGVYTCNVVFREVFQGVGAN